MIYAFILLPFSFAIVRLFTRSEAAGTFYLLGVTTLNLLFFIFACFNLTWFESTQYFALDELSLVFLGLSAIIFFLVNIYLLDFFRHHPSEQNLKRGERLKHATERLFGICFFLFMAAVNALCCAQHMGVFWIALELTTLASAPLIYYYHQQRALEAAWKYVLICSVGIGVALIGNILLTVAAPANTTLSFTQLHLFASQINPQWFNAAFIFFLIGFGTKMGLVPMHTWLPEAHGEAPAPVSAILSAVLLNGAFLGIMRIEKVACDMGQTTFTQPLLITMGLISLLGAAFFLIVQRDYKRMLAYSSIEHMGILLFGLGLGGVALIFVVLHLINHSFCKAALFLATGNIYRVMHTKSIASVFNFRVMLPYTSVLFLVALFAISGFPPFGLFITEFNLLRCCFDSPTPLYGLLFLLGLLVVFGSMSFHFLHMLRKHDSVPHAHASCETFLSLLPLIVLLLLTLILGCFIPNFLNNTLIDIMQSFSGGVK